MSAVIYWGIVGGLLVVAVGAVLFDIFNDDEGD